MDNHLRRACPQHYQLQMDVLHRFQKLLATQEFKAYPLIAADVAKFLEEFYEYPLDLNVKMSVGQADGGRPHVEVHWELPNAVLKVWFFGQGMWKYELHKQQGSTEHIVFSFEAQAYSFMLKDERQFVFCLEDYVQEHVQLEESFHQEVARLLTQTKYSGQYHDYCLEVWFTSSHYDGPISGYLHLDGQLHYFNLAEETPFQRKRLYAVYPLTWKEKCKIQLLHRFSMMMTKHKKLLAVYHGKLKGLLPSYPVPSKTVKPVAYFF